MQPTIKAIIADDEEPLRRLLKSLLDKAFENEAVDYLLKPVDRKRLQLTVQRLKNRLQEQTVNPDSLHTVLQHLQNRLAAPPAAASLKWIKVLDNQSIRLVAVDEIFCFQAQDKYTVVLTLDQEFLIRKPIKELLEELDPEKFWQIHRGTIVIAACIDRVGTWRQALPRRGDLRGYGKTPATRLYL